MSAPLCTVCLDTGSKSREMDADLDCTHCGAADERVAMGKALGPMSQLAEIFAWRAYQLGKAAAAPVAADAGRDDALEQAAKICNSHAQDQSSMHQHAEMYVADFLASKIRALINNPIVTDAPVVPVAAQPVVPEVPPSVLARTEEIRKVMANPISISRNALMAYIEFLLGHIAFTKTFDAPAPAWSNANAKPSESTMEVLRKATADSKAEEQAAMHRAAEEKFGKLSRQRNRKTKEMQCKT